MYKKNDMFTLKEVENTKPSLETVKDLKKQLTLVNIAGTLNEEEKTHAGQALYYLNCIIDSLESQTQTN